MTFLGLEDCLIDAREPLIPSDPPRLVAVDAVRASGPPGADSACWALTETNLFPELHPIYPPAMEENGVALVIEDPPGVYAVIPRRAIAPAERATIAYTDSSGISQGLRLFALPGDANADGTTNAWDVDALLDFLRPTFIPPWMLFSTDMDRSGRFTPIDLLRQIDLLNGAGPFAPGWMDVTVPLYEDCLP
jgi:hypothetical protein